MFAVKKKGGKSFAPKIRQRAPPSAHSSARPSVEPQSESSAPQTQPETITIRDNETPDPTNTPSFTVDSIPRPAPRENPGNGPSTTASNADTPSQNAAACEENQSLPTNAESLKRKSRNGEAGDAVEGPQKRHQPTGLGAPRTPPHSSPSSYPATVTTNPPSNFDQISTPLASQAPSESSAQFDREVSGGADIRTSNNEAVQSGEISQPRPRGPTSSVNPPAQLPVPQSASDQLPHFSSEAPSISLIPNPERSSPPTISNAESSQPASDLSEGSTARRPLPDGATSTPVSGPSPNAVPVAVGGVSSGLGAAGDLGGARSGVQLAQTPVIAQLNPDGTPGQAVGQRVAGTKKKTPIRRPLVTGDGDNVRTTVEIQLNQPSRPRGEKKKMVRKGRAKKDSKRAETPSDAEDQVIDLDLMTMGDMCKDLRVGKKFSKHDELRQREKDKIMKAKMTKRPELPQTGEDEEDGNGEGAPVAAADGEAEEESVVNASGPRMRIVDGQMVLDETSLQHDRHQHSWIDEATLVQVTENDFSQVITCGTHMKREKAQLWDMAANETFYKGLRMFGTDFQMIAGLFPHRNRRQIKLKFCKEEKDNPRRIDKVLKGAGSAIEIDTFEKLSGRRLESIADIEAEQMKLDAQHNAEEAERIAELAEIEQKKREKILSKNPAKDILDRMSDDEGHGDNTNKPKPKLSKQAMNRRKRKQAAADETVVVLGDA